MTKRHSELKMVSPLNIMSYLVILALSSSRLVQFKGLFDQAPLPLPLSFRVVRSECSAVVLISTAKKKEISWPSINVTINHSSSEWQNVANLTGTTTDHTYFL